MFSILHKAKPDDRWMNETIAFRDRCLPIIDVGVVAIFHVNHL